MTEQLYRADAYARDCTARVLSVNERGGIVLDRTVFYATAGGQTGDCGSLELPGGSIAIATTVYDADRKTIVHVPAAPGEAPDIGSEVRAVLDWGKRHRLMRMHTALHLLSVLAPYPVTGGSVGFEDSRLDFDIAEASAVDKDELTAGLNRLIAEDHAVSERWITDEELMASPELVKTMMVKPPMGTGRVRLVLIGSEGPAGQLIDRQPCGGTHVRSTAEIGKVAVTKIEKKGRLNRRVRLALV